MQRDFPQPQSQIRDLSTDLRSAREGDGHQDLVLPAHVDFNHSGPNQSSVHDRNRIHSDGMLLFGEAGMWLRSDPRETLDVDIAEKFRRQVLQDVSQSTSLTARISEYPFFEHDFARATQVCAHLAHSGSQKIIESLSWGFREQIRFFEGVSSQLEDRQGELPRVNSETRPVIQMVENHSIVRESTVQMPAEYVRRMARLACARGMSHKLFEDFPVYLTATCHYILNSHKCLSALGVSNSDIGTSGHRYTVKEAARIAEECLVAFGGTPILRSVFGKVLRGHFGDSVGAVQRAQQQYCEILQRTFDRFADIDPRGMFAVGAANRILLNGERTLESEFRLHQARVTSKVGSKIREVRKEITTVLSPDFEVPNLLGVQKEIAFERLDSLARYIGKRIASFRGGLSNDRHTIQDDLSQAAALAGFRALNDSTTNSNAQIVAIMIHAARIEARKYSISHEYEAKAYAFSTGKVDGWVRKSPRDAA